MDGLTNDYEITQGDDEVIALSSRIDVGVSMASTGPRDLFAVKREAEEQSIRKLAGFNHTDRENISNPLARVYREAGCDLTARSGGLMIVDQLADMHEKGLITDAEAASGARWRIDWMAYAHGVMDSDRNGGAGKTFDQAHVAKIARVHAGIRCREIRDGIGMVGEILLTMMLIDGNSANAIGKKVYSTLSQSAARVRAQGKCQMVIQQLAERFSVMDSQKRALRQQPQGPINPAPLPSTPKGPYQMPSN